DCSVEDIECFQREAEVLSGFEHLAVVRYVARGVEEDGGAPYFVMEWLDGEDLDERLERAGLTMAESGALATQIARPLHDLHGLGVVPRDIKPSNIFLRGGRIDQATIIDFGVARLARPNRTATRTGLSLGTPAYMAPEQARGSRALDERADIFSLGCVLFECLTGRPAFTGEHAMAVLAKVLLEDAPLVRDLRPDLPEALDSLVARMMSREPEGRPGNASMVLPALAALGSLEGERGFRRAPMPAPTQGLTGGEQRLVSMLLIEPSPEERIALPRKDDASAELHGR